MIDLGAVIRIEAFEVEPGVHRNKYLVIIGADIKERVCLACTTTSKTWRTPRAPICNANHEHPAFYLPVGSCFFENETWVQIHRFYELLLDDLARKIVDQKLMRCAVLEALLLKNLLDCVEQSDFITPVQLNMLGKRFVSA